MSRLERLRELAQASGMAAVALVPGSNFLYLTNQLMGSSERITMAVIPVAGDPLIICPQLEADKIRLGTGWVDVRSYRDEEGPLGVTTKALHDKGLVGQTIGCEYSVMRLMERDLIDKALGSVTIANASPLLTEMRICKDEQEVKLMERSVVAVEAGTKAARDHIHAGVTEADVAAEIERAIRQAGGAPSGIIVASGERSALPHAITSDRVIREGDMVVCDIVCRYKGYVADITRTFVVGHVDDELVKIYHIVQEAQAYARAHAKPGMTGIELDNLARDIITQAGYGQYYIHRTGHGIGLDVHEDPYLVQGNSLVFRPGMAFSIEPGIYLPNKGGVRIEDDMVMTADGVRSLTSYPRDLVVL